MKIIFAYNSKIKANIYIKKHISKSLKSMKITFNKLSK